MKINTPQNLWERLIGKPAEQTLEERIFHAVCVVSVIALAFAALFNHVLNIPKLSLIMVGFCTMVLLFYYLSRYKNKHLINIVFYGILSNLLFAVNYYYNSGIDGPTLLLFIISFFLIIVVAPPKQFWFWISLNLTTVFVLLLIQYGNNNLIVYTYPDKTSRFIDLFTTYTFIIFVIFFITKYIRNSYHAEQKAVEQKALELEVSNETKNKLLSIFAHDLRAPLDNIQSYLELLSYTHLTVEEKVIIEMDLLEKTQNTSQMLSNLLSWTRAQMDGVKVNLTAINLKESLENTIKLQQDIATKKGISIKTNLENNIKLIADKDMLQLGIRNLLNNAIKFTQDGGEIIMETHTHEENVIISINDNGIGIPQCQHQEIFSLKVKSSYGTKKEKGVGLGLVLCKEFIELQNGSIWFESMPGKGTTFFISMKSLS